MPTQASIAARVQAGFGVAASILGTVVQQIRPTDPLAPLAAPALTSLPAAFDVEPSLRLSQPAEPGRAVFYLLGDASGLAVGDYLVGDSTYFVASLDALRPAMVVRCNATLSLLRPQGALQAGLNAPVSDSQVTETVLLQGWPASVLSAGRGDQGAVGLPDDAPMGRWAVLLPATPGVVIRGADVLVDANGMRRQVAAAELTATGWRLEATQETA